MNRHIVAALAAALLLGWPAVTLAQAPPPAPATREARASADRAPTASPRPAPGWLASPVEIRQLQEIQAEGIRRVTELNRQAQGLRRGPELAALQQAVEKVKLETRLCFLETLAGLARARGYGALADDAVRAAHLLREAGTTAGPAVDMPKEKAVPSQEVRP
jgi:hypothetical protein